MAEFTLFVRELEIRMYLGIHPHEKAAPQRVLLSVEARTADVSGAVGDFIDYDAIVEFIRGYNGARIDTQEELAQSVHSFVRSLPGVRKARVTSCKPDIFTDCAAVGVVLSDPDMG